MPRRTGGRIPPDNRPVRAPGVGRNARRHDLERRATPYLHGSDLQQGDVQALEQGQRVQPIKRTQPPAVPQQQTRTVAQAAAGGPGPVPTDPIAYLAKRIGGTYQPKTEVVGHSRHDYRAWLPLLGYIARQPGTSGALASAYISRLHTMLSAPRAESHYFIDQQDADAALEELLGSE